MSTLVPSLVFGFSILGIATIFFIYPLLILFLSHIKTWYRAPEESSPFSVSLVTVAHNAADLIIPKIENSLSLRYPSTDFEIILISDGSTDSTLEKAKSVPCEKVHCLASPSHEGKNTALNRAVAKCSKEIIVFSDVDARLSSDAVLHLARHFNDPAVGGVCARRVIGEETGDLAVAQRHYIKFDTTIKKWESHTGNISSNEGKIFAMRRCLYRDIPPDVTDDLFLGLSVVREHFRFVFDPEVAAHIPMPSRNPSHEIERRRRIVSRSLRALYLMRELLNPFRYGSFSLRLLANKVARRMLPLFLLSLLFSNVFLYPYHAFFKTTFLAQMIFYGTALCHGLFLRRLSRPKIILAASATVYYFSLGNWGILLGILDFLRGEIPVKWEPLKNNSRS